MFSPTGGALARGALRASLSLWIARRHLSQTAGREGSMSERPFLPKGRLRRFIEAPVALRLGLWVLLILMFLGIWTFLEPSAATAPAGSGREGDAAPLPFSLSSPVTLLVPGALIFVIVLSVTLVRNRGFTAANGAGLKALADGDYGQAGSLFEGLA